MRRKSRPRQRDAFGDGAHVQRSFAAATAAVTSGRRGAGGGGSKLPSRTDAGHLLVRVAERDSVADERLGGVRREQQRIRRGGGEPVAVELEAGHEHRQCAERAGDVAPRREHRRLVLLQIAVVRERQSLHRRQQTGEPADRGSRLAARELGDVRVQLLRHHRRAGRRVLRQPGEAELRRRPEHELLADAREMREQHRGRVEIVEREVAVRDRVERVPHRIGRRAAAAASSPRAHRLRAATASPARPRTRSARGRARASPPTRADGGPASPAARAAGACSRASPCPSPRRRDRGSPRRTRRAPHPRPHTRPRRRAGTPRRPGRCASGRRGSSAPPRRAPPR